MGFTRTLMPGPMRTRPNSCTSMSIRASRLQISGREGRLSVLPVSGAGFKVLHDCALESFYLGMDVLFGDFQPEDPSLKPIAHRVLRGDRLTFEDGATLYRSNDLLTLGYLANHVRAKLHGKLTYFNVNRHINPTNVCVASCKLCAFGRKPDVPGAYTMALDEAFRKAGEGWTEAVTEFHIVGGLHPDLPFRYYVDLIHGL